MKVELRPGRQIAPSKAKPVQVNPSKIAWICLVLFVRIGTFQWVTAGKLKKIPDLLQFGGVFPEMGINPAIGKRIAQISDFRKQLRRVSSASRDCIKL